MAKPRFDVEPAEAGTIEHLLAGGQMLAAQLPSPSRWTREKRLAAAVLADALIAVREHYGERQHERRLAQDLRWIYSNDTHWPFAFVPLCDALGLEPTYVRKRVGRWLRTPAAHRTRDSATARDAA